MSSVPPGKFDALSVFLEGLIPIASSSPLSTHSLYHSELLFGLDSRHFIWKIFTILNKFLK